MPVARLTGWQMLPYGNGTIADQPVQFLENDLPTWLGLERWAKWMVDTYGEDVELDEEGYAFDLFDDSIGDGLTLEDLR